MKDAIILDSGPVGLLTNPNLPKETLAILSWLDDLEFAGRRVVLPDIVDYECRREYIRGGRNRALRLLDMLGRRLEYLPITCPDLRLAANLWAHVRNSGLPTASHLELDGDAILAAQALGLQVPVIVATGNPAHLRRFLPAEDWQAIIP